MIAAQLSAGVILTDGREVAEARIFEQSHEWLAVAVTFTNGDTTTYPYYSNVQTESEAASA